MGKHISESVNVWLPPWFWQGIHLPVHIHTFPPQGAPGKRQIPFSLPQKQPCCVGVQVPTKPPGSQASMTKTSKCAVAIFGRMLQIDGKSSKVMKGDVVSWIQLIFQWFSFLPHTEKCPPKKDARHHLKSCAFTVGSCSKQQKRRSTVKQWLKLWCSPYLATLSTLQGKIADKLPLAKTKVCMPHSPKNQRGMFSCLALSWSLRPYFRLHVRCV